MLQNCFPQAAQAPVGVVLSIDLCGKILRNLKMALNNIKKDFGKNLYGIWSPGNRFLWQVFSAKSTLVSFRSFTWRVPVASCFFQCLGQKEIDKIPSDWENSSKDTRSKWGEVFLCFPLPLQKKKKTGRKKERTKKREKKDLIAGFTCRQEP